MNARPEQEAFRQELDTMEILSEQHALVRKREPAQLPELSDGEVQHAVAELVRERRALRWERLACWAADRANRARSH